MERFDWSEINFQIHFLVFFFKKLGWRGSTLQAQPTDFLLSS